MRFNGPCVAKYYDKEMPRPVSIFLKSHHQVGLGRVTDSWAPKEQGRISVRLGSSRVTKMILDLGSGRVGSGRVGSDRVGSDRVGSGRVGSGRVGSDRVGSSRVGSDHSRLGSSRVESGQKILTDFEFYIRQIAGLYEIMVLLLWIRKELV
jgi:hypothetical protein